MNIGSRARRMNAYTGDEHFAFDVREAELEPLVRGLAAAITRARRDGTVRPLLAAADVPRS